MPRAAVPGVVGADLITDAYRPWLAAELASVGLCVSADGPDPEQYRAAAVFVACHAVLRQAGMTTASPDDEGDDDAEAWAERWWAAPHCGYSKRYTHPRLPGASCLVRCVSFGSVFVVGAVAMPDDTAEQSSGAPVVVIAQLEPTKLARVVPSKGEVSTYAPTLLHAC
jgi:hypothetical protein